MCVCVCVVVCACVRSCVRSCVCVCACVRAHDTHTHTHTHARTHMLRFVVPTRPAKNVDRLICSKSACAYLAIVLARLRVSSNPTGKHDMAKFTLHGVCSLPQFTTAAREEVVPSAELPKIALAPRVSEI